MPLGKCIIIHSANDYLSTAVTPDIVLTNTTRCSLRLELKHPAETDRVFTFKIRYVWEYFENGGAVHTACWIRKEGPGKKQKVRATFMVGSRLR